MSDPVYIGYYTLYTALSMPNDARFLMYDPAGPGSYNITGALLKSQILASPVITGQMTVPAGSASAPSLTFFGDTNTGLYSPAADTFGVVTTGVDRIRITSTGNVGIGTIAPGSTLAVSSPTNDTEVLRIGNSVGGGGAVQGINWIGLSPWGASSANVYSHARIGVIENSVASYRGSLVFSTRDSDSDVVPTERVRITSAGYVGIGTQTPNYQLQVSSSTDAILALTGGSSNYAEIFFGDTANNALGRIRYNNADDSLGFIVNGSQAALITSSGNIGIGVTTPDSVNKLQVNGNGKFTGNLTLDGSARRIIADFDNDTISNRTIFQTSTANKGTYLGVMPNGTNTTSSYRACNSSDPDNSGFINMFTGATRVGIASSRSGTGTTLPLTFGIGDTAVNQHMLTTSGNTILKTGVVAGDDDGVNKLQVDGPIKCTQFKLSVMNTAPAFPGDTGTTGEIRITGSHIYVCTATNNWVRAALSVW